MEVSTSDRILHAAVAPPDADAACAPRICGFLVWIQSVMNGPWTLYVKEPSVQDVIQFYEGRIKVLEAELTKAHQAAQEAAAASAAAAK